MVGGAVAAVEESYLEGRRVAGEALTDQIILPDVHEQVYRSVLGERRVNDGDALGVIETSSLPANVQAARPITFAGNVGPRLLLLHGGADLSISPEQAREMARQYREAGGEATVRVYPGANHMDPALAFAEARRWRYSVFKDVKAFVSGPRQRRSRIIERSLSPE